MKSEEWLREHVTFIYMRISNLSKTLSVGMAMTGMVIATNLSATAQNKQTINLPIIQTKYTADPAPYVHGDTVYLYTTHDEDDAEGFKMKDWLLYTSTDMVNWQDHGAVASLRDFKWYKGDNGAWAEQVIERNGKWYMYCPIHGNGIGVLVADSPFGPFKDPIGKPLVGAPNTGMTSTPPCGSTTTDRHICTGVIPTPIAFVSTKT